MFQRSVLDNQLRVMTSAMAHTNSVSMVICVGSGSRYETPEMAGVSHFIEHLPFKGTKKWPTAREVSEAIEGVGGIMNASTDREMTVFWVKVAKPHFKTAFAVLMDMVLHSRLDPEEVEKEREVIQEELRMTYDNPTYKVDLLIDEALWPDQAMGRDVGGTAETVSEITRDSIHEYMHRQYNPANTVVAIAGNITHEEVLDQVDKATGSWKPQPALDWERVTHHDGGPVVRMEQRRTDQTHLCLALPGLSMEDPDRYSLAMLNVMLGDGMSSRLFLNLREQQSLAYDVSSSTSSFRDCGSVVIYCGVEPKKSREAVRRGSRRVGGYAPRGFTAGADQSQGVHQRQAAAADGRHQSGGVMAGVPGTLAGPGRHPGRGDPEHRRRHHLRRGQSSSEAIRRGQAQTRRGRPPPKR